jgi:hypothetical protein
LDMHLALWAAPAFQCADQPACLGFDSASPARQVIGFFLSVGVVLWTTIETGTSSSMFLDLERSSDDAGSGELPYRCAWKDS